MPWTKKRTTISSSSKDAVAISPPRIMSTSVRVSRSSLKDTTSAGFVEAAHGFVARYDWKRVVVIRDISWGRLYQPPTKRPADSATYLD